MMRSGVTRVTMRYISRLRRIGLLLAAAHEELGAGFAGVAAVGIGLAAAEHGLVEHGAAGGAFV